MVSTIYYLKVVITLAVLLVILIVMSKFAQAYRDKRYTGEMKIKDRLPLSHSVSLIITQIKGVEYLMSFSGKDVKVLDKFGEEVGNG